MGSGEVVVSGTTSGFRNQASPIPVTPQRESEETLFQIGFTHEDSNVCSQRLQNKCGKLMSTYIRSRTDYNMVRYSKALMTKPVQVRDGPRTRCYPIHSQCFIHIKSIYCRRPHTAVSTESMVNFRIFLGHLGQRNPLVSSECRLMVSPPFRRDDVVSDPAFSAPLSSWVESWVDEQEGDSQAIQIHQTTRTAIAEHAAPTRTRVARPEYMYHSNEKDAKNETILCYDKFLHSVHVG